MSTSAIICDVGRVNAATSVAAVGDVTLYFFFIVLLLKALNFGISARCMGVVVIICMPLLVIFGAVAMGVLGGSCIEVVTASGPTSTVSLNVDVFLRASYAFIAAIRQLILGTTLAVLSLVGTCTGKSLFQEDIPAYTNHHEVLPAAAPGYPPQASEAPPQQAASKPPPPPVATQLAPFVVTPPRQAAPPPPPPPRSALPKPQHIAYQPPQPAQQASRDSPTRPRLQPYAEPTHRTLASPLPVPVPAPPVRSAPRPPPQPNGELPAPQQQPYALLYRTEPYAPQRRRSEYLPEQQRHGAQPN